MEYISWKLLRELHFCMREERVRFQWGVKTEVIQSELMV